MSNGDNGPVGHRDAGALFGNSGNPVFEWTLSATTFDDMVRLVVQDKILPVIFVPGIMGSNLMSNDRSRDKVWRLDTTAGQPLGLARRMSFSGPATRQRRMHPARTAVDPRGSIPGRAVGSVSSRTQYRDERFWGEVSEGSYHSFLLWLEERLNGQGVNPANWQDFYYTAVSAIPEPGQRRPELALPPGIPMRMRAFDPVWYVESNGPGHAVAESIASDDLIKRAKFRMPVYACGYNWLDSNSAAAERLGNRIEAVIAANNRNGFKCDQVILVTHSMGGLVARRCAAMAGMKDRIAGVVHGVMPAVGAAVAYRRCKVGMRDESFVAGLVIGSNGREVTAVFAQAPGALQLLPTGEYQAGWLKIEGVDGREVESLPASDPYGEIYLRRDRWWGLVRPEWLRPQGGRPVSWNEYALNISAAKEFHEQIRGHYHDATYVYYGADRNIASFERVRWQMKQGMSPDRSPRPSEQQVRDLRFDEVRDSGSNPLYVGGQTEYLHNHAGAMWGGAAASAYETSYWEISVAGQDGGGDGTVPTSSGRAPLLAAGAAGCIRQQFRMGGFEHEPSYKNQQAQFATLFSIQKIAAVARLAT
ncbi:GPI inositol-deacylase [Lysobacter sp. GX 14042]|uniref:esterase/lipase family protein n=1 Tax=Lysobacter sp. GX 14042 TaxID=2907155 RepID=UPI001F22E4A2|nr:GPI inositol-deacylase [Lysobacter sp. GX 14042]MCE7031168.1 GPI inositol-deacylase [Lysobacter sp. GX 14042]